MSKSISLKGWEAEALLIKHKTQLCRIVKGDVVSRSDGSKRRVFRLPHDVEEINDLLTKPRAYSALERVVNPFGNVGGKVLGKEAFRYDESDKSFIHYRASSGGFTQKWRPSVHMPHWAARFSLRVKAIRIIKIQDITGEDTRRQGVNPIAWGDLEAIPNSEIVKGRFPNFEQVSYRAGFIHTWERDYKGSWDRNDWVWVCDFEKDFTEEYKKRPVEYKEFCVADKVALESMRIAAEQERKLKAMEVSGGPA